VSSPRRGLAVLADGCHAAFAAGAVAELARRGRRWEVMLGAGMGAHVAALAGLGEAEEAARRWRRQSEQGCPLLAPVAEEAERRLRSLGGVLAVLDPWRLPGWLDGVALAEHLAPEAAGLPARLRHGGVSVLVLTLAVDRGEQAWENLEEMEPGAALEALAGACTFPGGWGPQRNAWGPGRGGGVGLLAGASREVLALADAWDVVCGFPVPPVVRDWLSDSLFEQIQRRDEVVAAAAVAGWLERAKGGELTLLAPTVPLWCRAEGREDAELGVEYPLSWERNGELVGRLLATGALAARQVVGDEHGERSG